MGKKFYYRVKDQITQDCIRDVDSQKDIEQDAKSAMQDAVKESHQANPFQDGEYYVDTYRSNQNNTTGPCNSFTVKDGILTFNEPPYRPK